MGSLAESFLYFGASGLRAYGFEGYGAPTKKKGSGFMRKGFGGRQGAVGGEQWSRDTE